MSKLVTFITSLLASLLIVFATWLVEARQAPAVMTHMLLFMIGVAWGWHNGCRFVLRKVRQFTPVIVARLTRKG